MRNMKKMDPTKIVVKGTEWFSSLAILNVCWLLFSLPLFTVIPATDTVVDLVARWETIGRPEGIFRQFKEVFTQNFKASFKRGLPFFGVVLLVGLDFYILNQMAISAAWFQIMKYAFYTFGLLILLALFYAYPLSKRIEEKGRRLFVLGFLTAIGNPLITLGVLGSFVALLVIFAIWPSMLFFFSVSGPVWLMTRAVSYILEKMEEKQTT